MLKQIVLCIFTGIFIFTFLPFNANAAITSYTTANGQLRITHNTADEGLYYDCNSSEIAQNIQILKADANAYHTIYHSEPKKTPGSAYPGDSIKTATQTGAFTYSIPSARTFRIFGHPTDTSSTLYSALTYDLNTASSGGANPMVVKGETDPNYYMLFMAVCDENKGHSGTDFRRFLCEAKTPDFSSIYLRTLVNRTVSWKLFNESVDITWRRPDFIYDTGGSIPIRSIRTTDVANAKGLTGSLCYYNGNYYYFYTDVNTDGRTYLYYRTISNISSFLNSDWSTATRVISSALMDDAIVRVAKAKDMDRWAVIYNGYKEIDVNVYQQDVFVQYTQNMNIVGSGGISSLTLYDSFFDIFLCGVSHYGLGLSSSTNDIYTQQYYMTDPYGALDIPGSSSNRGGLLTWADGITYGNNAYWAGWTTSYLTNSYFIPADIDDDGDVDFKDLKEITDSWLITDPTADLYVDSNNTINFKDFSVLGALWEVDRSCLAELTSPDLYKTLPGAAVTFQWSAGQNVKEYYLRVGNTGIGSSNFFSGSTGTSRSQLVTGLPLNGSTVYVRLSSKINGLWCYNDYIYSVTSFGLAEMIIPTPLTGLPRLGYPLTNATTFQWTAGQNVESYYIDIGTTTGGSNLYHGSYTTKTMQYVTGLPTNGSKVCVRLWSKILNLTPGWFYNDYEYVSANTLSSAPSLPALKIPVDYNSVGTVTSTNLKVRVTDPGNDTMSVTFYGRQVDTANDFRIVVYPDTQFYADTDVNDLFIHSAEVAMLLDPAAVLQVGDISNDGDNETLSYTEQEWDSASETFAMFDAVGIPSLLAIGNHDERPNAGEPTHYLVHFNEHFPVSRYASQPWWGGAYSGNTDNRWIKFSGGGMDFMAITPRTGYNGCTQGSLDWAKGVLNSNANRRAIVFTHALVNSDGSWVPNAAGGGYGQLTYDNLGAPCSNVFMMLSGHVYDDGVRMQTRSDGSVVPIMLFNYQTCTTSDGVLYGVPRYEGWLRVLEFSPSTNQIHVRSVKTWKFVGLCTLTSYTISEPTVMWDVNSNNRFTLGYNMNGNSSPKFTQVGTATSVPSGTDATVTWSGLQANKTYEWFAVVSDGTSKKAGYIWRFSTTSP